MATKQTGKTNSNKQILIIDLNVEFLATKIDDYDVKTCFFKNIDAKCLHKLDPLLSINEDKSSKVPVWRNEVGEFLMKAKSKFMPSDVEYIRGGLYIVDAEFIPYNMVVEQETCIIAGFKTLKMIQ